MARISAWAVGSRRSSRSLPAAAAARRRGGSRRRSGRRRGPRPGAPARSPGHHPLVRGVGPRCIDPGVCPQQLRRHAGVSSRARSNAGIPRAPTDETTASDIRHRDPARGTRRTARPRARRRRRPGARVRPRQVVVKFDGERAGRTLRCRRGPACAGRGVAARQPAGRLRRAELRRHRLGDEPRHRRSSSPTTPAPSTVPPKPRPAGRLDLQAVGLPALGRRRDSRLPISPGGIDAVDAWRNLDEVGRPGAEGVTVAVLDTGIAYRDLGGNSSAAPTSPPASSSRATTSSTTTACRSTKTGTAPTSPGRSARRPTTRSA